MSASVTSAAKATPSRRSFWLRQVIVWHWVSSGVCLGGMLLFTITGITLNHAASISAAPVVTQTLTPVPPALQAHFARSTAEGKHPIPPELAAWLAGEFRATPPEAPADGPKTKSLSHFPAPAATAG